LKSFGNPGFLSVSKRSNWKMNAILHHIGFVVPDIVEAAEIFEAIGLFTRTNTEPDPIQKVSASFVNIFPCQEVYVELLEPTDDSSPITNFLNKKGGGLHHLCFEVNDIEDTSARLKDKGFTMVTAPMKCEGFDKSFGCPENENAKIAFFMTGAKLLIELLQRS
jgi:methylmalonyl-CoA/ethylmalonyl-CoA epimerase